MSRFLATAILALACIAAGGCAHHSLIPFSTEASTPLVLVPVRLAGVRDERTRFREVFCAVLEARKDELPDYRPCQDALTKVGAEPPGSGRPVSLDDSRRGLVAALVPGLGYACIRPWLDAQGTVAENLRRHGFDLVEIPVDALSSCANNARQIRDAILAMPSSTGPARIVLVGYSKGAPDILEALVSYPEIRERIAAVVAIGGSIGGSPLADDSKPTQANLLRHFPKAECGPGDGGGVESLRTTTRLAWLDAHPLPQEIPYFSLAALPQPDRISSVLGSSHRKLSQVDPRNDSQMMFYDQVIPGGTLLGYVNADHWAVVLPIARTHPTVGSMLVTRNAYPREALLEAVLRFVEERLDQP